MERTTIRALTLADKMMKWAYKNDIYSYTSLSVTGGVEFECQANSYLDAHSFKKEFPQVGKLKKTASNTLKYTGFVKDIQLSVSLYAISKLPPSCKIEYEEVVVPYQKYIKAHIETRAKIVCDKDEKELVTA